MADNSCPFLVGVRLVFQIDDPLDDFGPYGPFLDQALLRHFVF